MNKYKLLTEEKMDKQNPSNPTADFNEYREEQRLYYDWLMWFSQDCEKRFSDAKSFEGRMVSISSGDAVFRCGIEGNSLQVGQRINMQFRVPRFGSFEPFSILLTIHAGRICHVCDINNTSRYIAIKFDEPLFFKPGEQGLAESEVKEKLAQAAI